jgi:hypothetical protein
MARWTQSRTEIGHFTDIAHALPVFGEVQLTLRDGQKVIGTVTGTSFGNNAGISKVWPPTAWYGECKIAVDNTIFTVDYLDIANVLVLKKLSDYYQDPIP